MKLSTCGATGGASEVTVQAVARSVPPSCQ
jgi:hypothetical protein